MIKTKLIYCLDKLLLLSFSIFLILAPYEHKYAGKTVVLIGAAIWFSINIIKYRLLFYRHIIPANPLNKPFLFFGLACLASIIFSINPYHSQEIISNRYILYLGFFLLGSALILNSKNNLYFLSAVFIISGVIFGLGGIRDYFYYKWANPVLAIRVGSVFGRHIPFYGFPLYLAYFIPFNFAIGVFARNKLLRILSIITFILLFPCLIWNASRAGWLAVATSLLYISFFKKKMITAYLATLVLAGLILAGLLLPNISPTIKQRVQTIYDPFEWSFRLPLYKSAINIFRDHSITGMGIGTFEKALSMPKYKLPADYPISKELNLHAHNTYLEIAAEMGIIGLSAFIWIFVAFFTQVFKLIRERLNEDNGNDKAILIGLSGTILSILIFALSTTIITVGVNNSAYFWFLLGIASTLCLSYQF